MAMVKNRTGQFSKSSVDSRKQRERASKLNQKPAVACDRAKVENKVDKFQGCRIIDLKYLISQLEDGCSLCGEALHLVNLEDETRHGLIRFHIKFREDRKDNLKNIVYYSRSLGFDFQ